MGIKHSIKQRFPIFGFDIVRFTPRLHSLARRKALLNTFAISLVIDVGAYRGLYAQELRHIGYAERIISYEPVSESYQALEQRAQHDDLWDTYKCALGDVNEQATINISQNRYSSSFLSVLPSSVSSAFGSECASQEAIDMVTLDSVIDSLHVPGHGVYLKIDTQGYEDKVLDGAKKALKMIDTIQLEMSIVSLYSEALLFDEMHRRLVELGYRLVSIEPGFTNEDTGELLQFDGVYHRYD